MIAALRSAARKLRRAPTRSEFMRLSGIHYCKLLPHFRGFRAAIRAAGLTPHPGGVRIDTAAMLADWARVARKVGRVPTRDEYDRFGQYATASLETRFHRWSRVHTSFLEFAESTPGQTWTDVAEKVRRGPIPRRGGGKSWLKRVVQPMDEEHSRGRLYHTNSSAAHAHVASAPSPVTSPHNEEPAYTPLRSIAVPPPLIGKTCVTAAMLMVLLSAACIHIQPATALPHDRIPVMTEIFAPTALRRAAFAGFARRDRAVMGRPLLLPGLAHEPVNEMGVVFLFGMLAHHLGFLVESMQAGFPDCEAKREVEPGRWQRFRIEFEYESRKFRDHRHDAAACDVIVCWKHNWAGCPEDLEVLELSSVVAGLG